MELRRGCPQPGDGFEPRVLAPTAPATSRNMHDLWARPRAATPEAVSAPPPCSPTSATSHSPRCCCVRAGGRSDAAGMRSLDHVVRFHNEVRLDDWWLHAKTAPAVGDLRRLAQGRIFHRDGTLLATVVPEGLLHGRR
ncbi:hypothetical protein ACFSZT_21785 [Prauserella oleivorans]|uniref:hypothetical protein n=1 Tax=Prauserella oleivorans TaxID=1478153 RepID=UPI0036071778